IATGDLPVVGVNRYTEGIPSPLLSGDDGGVFKTDNSGAEETLRTLEETRVRRDEARVRAALEALKAAAREGRNMMEPSIECALARVTTGEWAGALREVFGEYRPATGIEGQRLNLENERVEALRRRIGALIDAIGHRPRIVLGTPGLDGHSNGAEMIAVAARHVGFDVIYSGIRLTPEQIVESAIEEDADVIGVSILSGSHLELADQIFSGLEAAGAKGRIPVIMGGIIPKDDGDVLLEKGVSKIFTPADFEIIEIMEEIVSAVEKARG